MTPRGLGLMVALSTIIWILLISLVWSLTH